MKLFEKKDSGINIEEDDLQDAKLSSLDFVDKKTRKRAFLNVLGARLAMKMLFSQKIEATNLYSLYTIHNVLNELDIADIYFQGIKIDVRVVFNKEEIFIPKSHFEWDLLPDLYLVFDLAEDFSGVEFIGFFEPKTLNTQNENKDFYFYEHDRLQDPKTLKMFLHNFKGNGDFKAPVNLENAEALFVSLVDKEISQQDKEDLFQCLAGDIALREKVVEFENFETLSKEVVKDTELMRDGIFDIVGAQQIYEDEEFSVAEDKAEIIGEVLVGMLDGEDETPAENIVKNEFNKDDIESILSEIEEEHKDFEDNSGTFAAGASAGAIAGAVVAGGAVVATAIGAGLENNLFEALPDLDLDLDLNFGGSKEDLLSITEEESNKYETIDTKEDLLSELSTLEGLEDFEETVEVENDSTIQAKFFGGLEDEEIGNRELEIEEIVSSEELEVSSDFVASQRNLTNQSSNLSPEETPHSSLLTPNSSVEEEVVTFDEIESDEIIIPKNYDRVFNGGDDETLERLRKLEADEDGNQDEVISQVDEFLKDADLSGEKLDLSAEGLDIDNLDSSLLNPSLESEVSYFSESNEGHALESETSSQNTPVSISDEQIRLLFKEEKAADIPEFGSETNNLGPAANKKPLDLKDKKMLIAASVAGVIIISVLATQSGMFKKNSGAIPPTNASISTQGQAPAPIDANNTNDANDAVNAGNTVNTTAGNSNVVETPASDTGADPLLQPAPPPQGNSQANANRDMGKAVSDAFLSEPVSASISKVAWEVPEDLAYNDGFRKYLQMAGKNLKLNLQNNLLLATEMAYSNKVVVDLTINKDGSLQSNDIVTSSGSKQIDKIVLQSVKETLTYLKIPANELSGNSVDATLIINF